MKGIFTGRMLALGLMLAAACVQAKEHADDAGDVVTSERIGMGLAAEIAEEAIAACTRRGYAVTAVVVDRSGDPQVMMRATHAPRFTRQIATDKARAVILAGIDSGAFRANREDIRMEMNHVDGILMLDGAVAIESAGSTIGALGISGAPGGDKDTECAREALDAFFDRLQLR